MAFSLRPGVTFCEVSGRIVFLDVIADRYFMLADPAEQVFRTFVCDNLAAPCAEIEQLVGSGLFRRSNEAQPPTPCRLSGGPVRSLLDVPRRPVATSEKVAALVALARTRRKLRRTPLHEILASLSQQKSTSDRERQAGYQTLHEVATAFEWTARLVRSHDQCLPRSLAVSQRLTKRGAVSTLVLGVRLRPFAAHSWVQTDEWLLNDRYDTVRTYTPILAI